MSNSSLRKSKIIIFIALNVLLFSLVSGYIAHGSSLGWGDSLNQLSRPYSVIGYFNMWWHELNGRVSQAALYAFLLMPLRSFAETPELYPWWLIRSISTFCTFSTTVFFVAIMPNSVLPKKNLSAFLLILYIWLLWALNPVVYETSAWFTAAEFVGYSGPIFLISLTLFISTKFKFYKINYTAACVLALLGFIMATIGEQYLLAFPVLMLGVQLSHEAGRRNIRTLVLKVMPLILFGNIIGFLIYWMAPAQKARNKLLGIHIDNVWNVYIKSVQFGYQFLTNKQIEGMLLMLLVLIHTGALAFSFVWAWNDYHRRPVGKIYHYKNAGLFCLTLLLAYHACFLTLIVSDYFPGYAAIFPGLLLTLALLVLSLPLIYLLLRSGQGNILRLIAALGMASIFAYLSVHDIAANIETEQQLRANNQLRRSIYSRILADADLSDNHKYILHDCPHAVPKYGWSMEPPWGLEAYFRWRGITDIKVYLEGNYDFPKDAFFSDYTTIRCVSR